MSAELLTRLEIQTLHDHYVDALDNDRIEEWPDFFVEDCFYEIIPKENVDMGLPAPVIHCDNKRMLRDRVISLRNANIYAPATYRHFLSGLVWRREGEEIAARSSYVVINTSQAGVSIVYQSGRYEDRLVATDDGWRFRERRVIFDTSRIQTLLAIPI